jgi:hypothetical protein
VCSDLLRLLLRHGRIVEAHFVAIAVMPAASLSAAAAAAEDGASVPLPPLPCLPYTLLELVQGAGDAAFAAGHAATLGGGDAGESADDSDSLLQRLAQGLRARLEHHLAMLLPSEEARGEAALLIARD